MVWLGECMVDKERYIWSWVYRACVEGVLCMGRACRWWTDAPWLGRWTRLKVFQLSFWFKIMILMFYLEKVNHCRAMIYCMINCINYFILIWGHQLIRWSLAHKNALALKLFLQLVSWVLVETREYHYEYKSLDVVIAHTYDVG